MDIQQFILQVNDPRSRAVFNYIKNTFDVKSIEYYYDKGLITGSNINTYAVKVLYLAERIEISRNGVGSTSFDTTTLRDASNAVFQYLRSTIPLWDSAANQIIYFFNNYVAKYTLFSNLQTDRYTNYEFSGYKIVLK
jgi:hypothetical protein